MRTLPKARAFRSTVADVDIAKLTGAGQAMFSPGGSHPAAPDDRSGPTSRRERAVSALPPARTAQPARSRLGRSLGLARPIARERTRRRPLNIALTMRRSAGCARRPMPARGRSPSISSARHNSACIRAPGRRLALDAFMVPLKGYVRRQALLSADALPFPPEHRRLSHRLAIPSSSRCRSRGCVSLVRPDAHSRSARLRRRGRRLDLGGARVLRAGS